MGLLPDLKSLEKIIADRLQETNDRLDEVIRLLGAWLANPSPANSDDQRNHELDLVSLPC